MKTAEKMQQIAQLRKGRGNPEQIREKRPKDSEDPLRKLSEYVITDKSIQGTAGNMDLIAGIEMNTNVTLDREIVNEIMTKLKGLEQSNCITSQTIEINQKLSKSAE